MAAGGGGCIYIRFSYQSDERSTMMNPCSTTAAFRRCQFKLILLDFDLAINILLQQ